MHQIPKHLPRRDRDLRTWTKHRLDARLHRLADREYVHKVLTRDE